MKRTFALLVAGAALAAVVAPIASSANHCDSDIIIFSGVDTGQTDQSGTPIRPGPNGTLAGCLIDPADESLAVIWPGATNMVVAYTVPTGDLTPTGALTFAGSTTPLTFKFIQPLYATSPRWESQSIPTTLGSGPVTAVIFLDGEEADKVTYTKHV